MNASKRGFLVITPTYNRTVQLLSVTQYSQLSQQRNLFRINARTSLLMNLSHMNTRLSSNENRIVTPSATLSVRLRRSKRDHTVKPPKKLKTKSSVAQRFRFTSDGRIRHKFANKQHHSWAKKNSRKIRKLSGYNYVTNRRVHKKLARWMNAKL
jgi:ribosomal protein L35